MKKYLDSKQNEKLATYEKFTHPSSLRWVQVGKEHDDEFSNNVSSCYRRMHKLEFHPFADDIESRPCWILADLIGFVDDCIKQGYEWNIAFGNRVKSEVRYKNKSGEDVYFNEHDEIIDNLYDAIISFLED